MLGNVVIVKQNWRKICVDQHYYGTGGLNLLIELEWTLYLIVFYNSSN